MIYNDILIHVKTIDQGRELSSEIDILINSLFKTENNAFEKALDSVTVLTSQMLISALGGLKNNINWDKQMITEYLTGLKEELQKLKTLKLSLAFEPSKDLIDHLFIWIIKNLGYGIILDIQKDKTILGGAIIEFEGKYEDLSLKKALDEVFGTKRMEITDLLNS
jgi:F0F1-type ATP synthase delta subunit